MGRGGKGGMSLPFSRSPSAQAGGGRSAGMRATARQERRMQLGSVQSEQRQTDRVGGCGHERVMQRRNWSSRRGCSTSPRAGFVPVGVCASAAFCKSRCALADSDDDDENCCSFIPGNPRFFFWFFWLFLLHPATSNARNVRFAERRSFWPWKFVAEYRVWAECNARNSLLR